MANVAGVIEESFRDVDKVIRDKGNTEGNTMVAGSRYDITQEINIYSNTDDPIEAAKRFRDAQREAAKEW